METFLELQEITFNRRLRALKSDQLFLFLNFQTGMGCAFAGSLMCRSGHARRDRRS